MDPQHGDAQAERAARHGDHRQPEALLVPFAEALDHRDLQRQHRHQRRREAHVPERPERRTVGPAVLHLVHDGEDGDAERVRRGRVDHRAGVFEPHLVMQGQHDHADQRQSEHGQHDAAQPVAPVFGRGVAPEPVRAHVARQRQPHRRQQDVVGGKRAEPRRVPVHAEDRVPRRISQIDGQYAVQRQPGAERRVVAEPTEVRIADARRHHGSRRSVTVNVLPTPTSLDTAMSPPTMSMTRRTSARPRPLPCVACEVSPW